MKKIFYYYWLSEFMLTLGVIGIVISYPEHMAMTYIFIVFTLISHGINMWLACIGNIRPFWFHLIPKSIREEVEKLEN